MGSVALGLYHVEQKRFYQLQLLTEMDAFSYVLSGDEFSHAIYPLDPDAPIHELIVTRSEVYALFPWVKNPSAQMIKVSYPYEAYQNYMETEIQKILLLFGALGVVSIAVSLLFARYTLTPMRRSLLLMEDFLKDIIHDLGTPVSSILLNAQMLKRKHSDEEIERIMLSAQTITGLYKNLEALYRELPMGKETIDLGKFLRQRNDYFQTLYPLIAFSLQGEEGVEVHYNQEVLMRIVDNLLSNAAKYNRPGGEVFVSYDEDTIQIRDTGIGIRAVDKVFERFYKENERGVGMGLHIVKTLAEHEGSRIGIESEEGRGTTVTLTLR